MVALALLALLPAPAPLSAQQPDYQALYEQASRSASMWKERAAILEKENRELKEQVGRLRGKGGATTPAAEPARNPAPDAGSSRRAAAEPRRAVIEVPLHGAVNLQSYGGPALKVNVWSISMTTALVQVGNEAKREVRFPTDGRALLHSAADGSCQVYIRNDLTSGGTVKFEVVQP